jgi:F-type H+-transporting ATPase subunit epsilon
MAEKPFKVEIVTPKGLVFSGDIMSFSAPGVVGGFQVLKNHAPLLSSIAVGEVKIVDLAGNVSHYATSGGVVEVHDNKVMLLAETAERSDEIDVARAQAACDRARKRLAEKKSDLDVERARTALFRALNRLKVANQL